jgi:hypothetical protein
MSPNVSSADSIALAMSTEGDASFQEQSHRLLVAALKTAGAAPPASGLHPEPQRGELVVTDRLERQQ